MPHQYHYVYGVDDTIKRVLDAATQRDIRTYQRFGSTFFIPLERKFGDIPSVQRYVDAVAANNWVRANWPEKAAQPVRVHARVKDNQIAAYRQGQLSIPDHGGGVSEYMRELTVLHELAHHYGAGGHGPKFQAAYVELVRNIMDEQLAYLLQLLLQIEASNG